MDPYPSVERARLAAERRLAQVTEIERAVCSEWLHEITGTSAGARAATVENAAFWGAVVAAEDPRPILLRATDLFLAAGQPGWARILIFLTGLNHADSELRLRLREAQAAEADPDGAIQQGVVLHDRARFEEAIAVYDEVILRYPGGARARHEKALSLATLLDKSTDEVDELCREAQRVDPFYASAWVAPDQATVFGEMIAPILRGAAHDRPALKRFGHGLQILGLRDLAALTWLQLLHAQPDDAENAGALARSLTELGVGQALDGREPAPDALPSAEATHRLAELRRAVAAMRQALEGEYAASHADVTRATKLLEMATRLGSHDLEVALAHNLLGAMYQGEPDLSRAETHLRQALMILEGTELPDDPNLVMVVHNLAINLIDQHRLPEARQFLRRELEIVVDVASRSMLLQALASVELRLGNLDEAERLVRDAEGTSAASRPAEQQVWSLLTLQAEIARARGDPARAIEFLERLLTLQTAALGASDTKVAVTQNNLAMACEEQGARDQAEKLLRDSLTLRQLALGPTHPDVATAENNLGLLLARDNRLDEARAHLTTALELRQAGLPDDDPLIPVTLVNVAQVETALGARGEALRHLGQALVLDTRLRQRLALGRTPLERSALVAEVGRRMGVLIWTALAQDADPEAQRLAANCILARKDDPERATAPQAPEYRIAVRSLASLLLGGPRSRDAVEYRQALDSTEERIERLNHLGPPVNPAAMTGDRLSAVRAALGDRVLLEYVRVEAPGGPGQEAETARYVLMLLGSSLLQVVPLAHCERVDRLVRQFREAMDEAPAWVIGNERAAEARVWLVSQALYQELIAPVRGLISDTRRVVVAPDSDLHLVPFGTLVSPDRRYLVEDLEVVNISSGSDLLRQASWPNVGGEVCVFVDPDFELEPPHAVPRTADLHYSRIGQYLASATWTRLEATQGEAHAIVEALPGESVRVFSGADASEASLFTLHSPRILHISTHGFFLNSDELPPLPSAPDTRFEIGVPAMFCSGLALAGAGSIARRSVSGLTDKGLITALEVATLDLRGTEVAVLSGCETAVGSPIPGEGVLGLRRAFQQAGADQLVASLWRVPETESAALLGRFYGHLGSGDCGAALRAACLEMLEQRRAATGAAHPLFWGGFVAIGLPHALRAASADLPEEDGQQLELELPDGIQAIATAHTLEVGGPLPVVTLVSRGLAHYGAPELAVTVLRKSPPSTAYLISLFGSALLAADSGHPAAVGDLLPTPGAASAGPGFGRFERAMVWHPNELVAVPDTREALTLHLLTPEEARQVEVVGPLRLMARLGQATAFYPTAPWIDPRRDALIDDDELEHSVLGHGKSLRLPNTRISRIQRAGREGLSIEVGREHAEVLEQLLAPEDVVGVSLLGHEDPEADAIMVWRRGAPPTAIVPGPPHATRFALNFVIALRGDEDSVAWVEDGAMWTLSPATFSRLRSVIAECDVLDTPVADARVRWAWTAPAEINTSVRLDACQLVTPPEQAENALTVGEIGGLAERTRRAVEEAIKGLSRDAFNLVVELALQPDGGLRVRYQSSRPNTEDLFGIVNEALRLQDWPMLAGGEVEIAMQFSLGGADDRVANPVPDAPNPVANDERRGHPTMQEGTPAAGPFADYVRVRMTIWSEVDVDILLDGECVTRVDHTTGFDYASASITVSKSSRLVFKAAGFELTLPVLRLIDPEKRTVEARIGTGSNSDIVISKEQKVAAMGSISDVPRLAEDLLTNVKSAVRYTAADRLGYIGGGEAVAALLESLRAEPDPYVKARVASALGRIGDGSVIPALQQALETYDRKESYGYMFEAALRDLEFLRSRETPGATQ